MQIDNLGKAAIAALRDIGEPSCGQILFQALQDHYFLYEDIIDALSKLDWKPSSNEEQIIYFLCAGQAADCIALDDPETIFNVAVRNIEFDNLTIQNTSIEVLGLLGNPASLVVFENIPLEGIHDSPLENAATAIGRIGDPAGISLLLRYLVHRSVAVRTAAARSLGYFQDPRAAKGLVIALHDDHPIVRETAKEAILNLGNHELLLNFNNEVDLRTLESLRERWNQYLEHIRRYSKSTPEVMRYFTVTEVVDNLIVLETNNKIYYERIAPFPEKIQALKKALFDMFHVSYDLNILLNLDDIPF